MSCGLKDEELFILNLLYQKHCFKRSGGYHSDKLDKLFRRKFDEKSGDAVKNLRNLGYLGAVGKSPEKYYISDISNAMSALSNHGYNVTQGRERPL